MKAFLVFILLYLIYFPLQAQQLKFSPSDDLLHALCNIKSSPGILGNYYYVWYNDYGPKLDFTNNFDSYLKIYSVKQGKLVKSVFLNPLVPGADNKTYFTNVIRWKDHILGLYVIRKILGEGYKIHAQLFDRNGKKLGKTSIIGAYPSQYYKTSYFIGSRASDDKRSTVSYDEKLFFAFNSDSSQMVFYTVENKPPGRLGFIIVDEHLNIIKKVFPKTSFLNKRSEIIQFKPDKKDKLYLLIRHIKRRYTTNYSYSLSTINISSGAVNEMPLSLPGKTILDAMFSFDKQGNIIVTGSYYNNNKPGNNYSTNGMFAIKVDAEGQKIIHSDTQNFSDKILKELGGKKGKGLDEIIQINYLINTPGGGIASFGQSHHVRLAGDGTDPLKYYFDFYGNIVFSKITSEGKIKWNSYVARHTRNPEGYTSTAPVCAFNVKNNIIVIYDGKNKHSKHKHDVCFDIYNNEGKVKSIYTALPKKYDKGTDILWNTAQLINSNEIIATYYKAKKKEMGTVKIILPSL